MGRSLVYSGSIMVKMGYFMDLTGPSEIQPQNGGFSGLFGSVWKWGITVTGGTTGNHGDYWTNLHFLMIHGVFFWVNIVMGI